MKHQEMSASKTMSMLCTPVGVKLMVVCKTDQKKMKFIGGHSMLAWVCCVYDFIFISVHFHL